MRKARKSLAILLAVAMVFCMAPAMVFGAGDDGQVNRIAGNDRYITSAETALRAFESADTVLIARGDDEGGFADGLAASYLAGVENAPILLTEPNGLPPVVKDAISKLGAKKAIILGGPAVVSDKVKDDLAGLEVERIFGDDRFETAAKIAAKGKADTAFVVSGYAPADSLVAGPLAFSKNYPILLVGNNVPDFTSKALADLGIKNIYVIGGTGVVSESVYNDLAAKADQIVRYGGNDRVATSLEVAQNLYTNPVNFSIVGYDGLADAVGAAVFGNPILYTDSDLGISGIQSYLAGAVTADSNVNIFGGTGVVSNAAETALENIVPDELKVEIVSAIDANRISVTFDNEETVEIKLEEALVHGENEVTFEYEGQTFTVTVNYEDPEVVEEEKAEAIKNAIDKINAIGKPATLTLEDEAKVVAARTAVNAAKELGAVDADIVNLDHLIAAETQINALKEALNEKETAIQEANVALTNLPLEVTLEDKEQVEEARELVDKALELGAEENDFVNLWKLTDAEAKIAELEEEAAEAEAVQAVIDAIDALPEEITLEDAEAVADARAAYDALTEEQQELVTNVDVLEAAEAKIAELEEEAAKKVTVTKIVEVEKDKVTVEIKPYDKDRLGEEIEILDNNGNKVAVKPVDIPAGDTTVFFEFVETQTKQEGVWIIAGHEYDFDLAAKLDAFVNAAGQIELNKALADLGIENVKVENMPAYETAKVDFLADLEGDLTVEAIQAWIDEVNTNQISDADSKAIAKKVLDAKDAGNDVALLAALQDEAFVRVNPEWLGDYKTAIVTTGESVDDTVAKIQVRIDSVNTIKISAELDNLKTGEEYTSVNKTELLAAKDLIAAYAPVNDKGEIKNVTIKAAPKAIDIQLAVADVLAATTPTTLKVRLTTLAGLVNEADKDLVLDMDTYVDANGKLYIDQIKTDEVKTAKAVQTAINTVNSNLEITFEVKTDGVTNPDPANVSFGNIEDGVLTITGDYLTLTEYKEDGTTPPSTQKWIGMKISFGNGFTTNKVKLTVNGEVRNEQLGHFQGEEFGAQGTLYKYIAAKPGGCEYKFEFEVYDVEDETKVIARDGFTVKFVDELSQEGVKELVNAAETAADVNDALLQLATLKGENQANDAYLNVPSADRMYVAEKVLEARDDDTNKGEFAAYSNLNTALNTAIGDRKAALDEVLGLKGSKATEPSKIADVIAALELVDPEGFAKMSIAEKSDIAEAFFAGLEFDENGALKTTFRTLAAVKEAAGL